MSPTKEEDLATLELLAETIETGKSTIDALYEVRRTIWQRRLDAKDTKKAELARASRCHSMNITQGLRPELLNR